MRKILLVASATLLLLPACASAADRTAPKVTLTAPANGSTVAGTVNMTATATDNVRVDHVTFRVDGTAVGSDFSAPYSLPWNTTTKADGSHTVSVRAADSSGNTSVLPDPTATVTVRNVVPTPTPTPSPTPTPTATPSPTPTATPSPTPTATPSPTPTATPSPTPTPTPDPTPTRVAYDTTAPSTPGTINTMFPRPVDYCSSTILLNTLEVASHGNLPYDVARDDLGTQGWGDGDSRFSFWNSESMWITRRGQINDHYSNGTTDHALTTTEAFSFAACRWGIREDLLRAVAVQESDWCENAGGTYCSSSGRMGWGDRCSQTDPSKGIGSYGIVQQKNLNCSNQGDWGGFPRSYNSVPFSVDSYGAAFRTCLEAGISWNPIPAGDSDATKERGCVGQWFSGNYEPSSTYTNGVYAHLANRDWEHY